MRLYTPPTTAPFPLPTPDNPRRRGKRQNSSDLNAPMIEEWIPTTLRRPDWVSANAVEHAQRAHDLFELTRWMSAATANRWAKRANAEGKTATYCDHYSTDWFSQWLGYDETNIVPPAFGWWVWTDAAVAKFAAGAAVSARTGVNGTLQEATATTMYAWMERYAVAFGWLSFASEQGLRDWMNAETRPGMIIAKKKPGGIASHVAVALPDIVERVATVRLRVANPNAPVLVDASDQATLTSEAGGTNRTFTRRRWWKASSWDGVQYLGAPW